jgi:hypothetical protein
MRFVNYYGQFQGFRGQFGGLPSWARTIIGLMAIPGVVLLALSLLAVLASILALLLLTVPAYRLLSAVTASRSSNESPVSSAEPSGVFQPMPSPGRRHVEVKIVE